MIEVVAAFIKDSSGRVLLTKRPQEKSRGGYWEFPGGKVEKGETHEEALRRELFEELGLKHLKIGKRLAEVEHEYPDIRIKLYLYEVKTNESIKLREAEQAKWFHLNELSNLKNMCEADKKLTKKLL